MGPVKSAMITVICRIPEGKVTNYGTVAEIVSGMVNKRISPQVIGRLLSGMKQNERPLLPRQRVVNKQGFISTTKLGDKGRIQQQLLEQEGIQVINKTVDMKKYGIMEREVLTNKI